MTTPQRQLDTLTNGTPVFSPQEFISIVPTSPPQSIDDVVHGVIVSMPVAQWLADTDDLEAVRAVWGAVYVADTGPSGALRDEYNCIVGTKRLCRYV
jgi:hypothetical protein